MKNVHNVRIAEIIMVAGLAIMLSMGRYTIGSGIGLILLLGGIYIFLLNM